MRKLSKQLVMASMLILVVLGAKARNLEKDTVFHNERDINFKVYEDGSSVVLKFSSENKRLVKLMEQLGLNIYFNEEMKKRDDIYINYPIGSRTEIGLDEDEQKELQAKRRNQEIDYRLVLKKINDEAEYGYYEKERIFNILLNSLEVKGDVHLDEDEVVHYRLEVPKKLINPDDPDQVDAFKIGIESGAIPVKQRRRTASAANRMSRRMGRGRMGRRGRQRRGMQQNNTSTITIDRYPVEIWFDVKL